MSASTSILNKTINDELLQSLGLFESIELQKTSNKLSLKRIDRKFLLSIGRLPDFLKNVSNDYLLITVGNSFSQTYKTNYYDTEDLFCYNSHHLGRSNRYKLRSREYVESGNVFDEIKVKNNHGVTKKYRLQREVKQQHFDDKFRSFATKTLGEFKSIPAFQLEVEYNRIACIQRNMESRLTIDFNLSFSHSSEKKFLENLVIVELKSIMPPHRMSVFESIRKAGLKESRFSKYCFGMASLRKNLRKNNFIQIFRTIDRL